MLSQKGYLGPIGDDIPSLIPIIVGLLTFFAGFTYTLNEFNLRSQSFTADRDTLLIANSLKGDSYISSFHEFDIACQNIRVRGINYAAGIVESTQWNLIQQEAQQALSSGSTHDPPLSFIANHFFGVLDPITGQTNLLSCSSGIPPPITQADLANILVNRPYVVLIFPIALEISTAVIPATLVVITWRV